MAQVDSQALDKILGVTKLDRAVAKLQGKLTLYIVWQNSDTESYGVFLRALICADGREDLERIIKHRLNLYSWLNYSEVKIREVGIAPEGLEKGIIIESHKT